MAREVKDEHALGLIRVLKGFKDISFEPSLHHTRIYEGFDGRGLQGIKRNLRFFLCSPLIKIQKKILIFLISRYIFLILKQK